MAAEYVAGDCTPQDVVDCIYRCHVWPPRNVQVTINGCKPEGPKTKYVIVNVVLDGAIPYAFVTPGAFGSIEASISSLVFSLMSKKRL